MKCYEQFDFKQNGYSKLFHFNNWRLATLEYVKEIDESSVDYLECHNETDEVFILLKGHCKMVFFKDNDPASNDFECIDLKPQQVYRILKGVYHAHRISKDAKIVLVEEESTSQDNSHRRYLTLEQQTALENRG